MIELIIRDTTTLSVPLTFKVNMRDVMPHSAPVTFMSSSHDLRRLSLLIKMPRFFAF
jgi:hypothetical protein